MGDHADDARRLDEQADEESFQAMIDNKCPDCGAKIRAKELWEGGGIVCADKCGYWFCY